MGPGDFEALLRTSIGLNAASIGSSAVARAVQQRLAACQLRDPIAYWDRVRASDTELQALIEAVVVPETWFFRDRESFAALAGLVRDDILRGRPAGIVTILSLPCSTGEEPYSMAMALLDAGVPANRFRVFAVDVSEAALSHAARAVYGRNSFRGGELSFRDRYFSETVDGYHVSESVRDQVHFQRGNLFADDLLSGPVRFDVIFCRNVLIYFDRETQDRAILVLSHLMTPRGFLFVAPAETGLPPSHGFVSIGLPLAFGFRRSDAARLSPGSAVRARLQPLQRIRPIARTVPPPPPVARAAGPAAAGFRQPASKAAAGATADVSEATRLADQGHFVEAATACETHLRQHGPSAAAYYLLGLVRDATGNQAEAGEYYRKALYLDPVHCDAQIQLAFLMEKEGDSAGAQVLRNRARRLGRHT
jgi:chemotaxis protein methyltransferase WspC